MTFLAVEPFGIIIFFVDRIGFIDVEGISMEIDAKVFALDVEGFYLFFNISGGNCTLLIYCLLL